MSDGRTSISQANTDQEIGEFWDTHDAADYWEETEPVEFEVDIESQVGRQCVQRITVDENSGARSETGPSGCGSYSPVSY